MRRLALLLALLPLPALGQDFLAFGLPQAPPAEWQGPERHFLVVGTINGRPIGIGPLDWDDPDGFAWTVGATRHYLYEAGSGGWRNAVWRYLFLRIEFEVAEIEGHSKVALVIRNRDFRQLTVPGTYELVARRGLEGAEVGLRVHAEWQTDDTLSVEEAEGWTGTLTLQEDSGTVTDSGFLLDGRVAGHIDATRGEDHLAISFTVPVTGIEH